MRYLHQIDPIAFGLGPLQGAARHKRQTQAGEERSQAQGAPA